MLAPENTKSDHQSASSGEKKREKKAEREVGQACETIRVGIEKVKSPSLLGGNCTLDRNIEAKEQSVYDAPYSGSRKHSDDVVADRHTQPDLYVPRSRQQFLKSTIVSETM